MVISKVYLETCRKATKKRLMRRCRNLGLRIKLDEEINKIKKELRKILKNIHKTFIDYCAFQEQIIKF